MNCLIKRSNRRWSASGRVRWCSSHTTPKPAPQESDLFSLFILVATKVNSIVQLVTSSLVSYPTITEYSVRRHNYIRRYAVHSTSRRKLVSTLLSFEDTHRQHGLKEEARFFMKKIFEKVEPYRSYLSD
jgi:hypothetical protein